jgi:hypothetical protein
VIRPQIQGLPRGAGGTVWGEFVVAGRVIERTERDFFSFLNAIAAGGEKFVWSPSPPLQDFSCCSDPFLLQFFPRTLPVRRRSFFPVCKNKSTVVFSGVTHSIGGTAALFFISFQKKGGPRPGLCRGPTEGA